MMKKKVKIFDIVLIVIFTVFSLVMIIPVYKVLVDSFDLKTAYGMVTKDANIMFYQRQMLNFGRIKLSVIGVEI